jgi:hypothetical protein
MEVNYLASPREIARSLQITASLMKYSQLLGLLACIGEIFACFMIWVFVAERNLLISGINEAVPNFGRPGMFNIVLSIVMGILFIIPKIWSKRTNVIIAAINLSWSFRNYLVITACRAGECPEKRAGIYLLLCLSIFILLMSFLPPIKVPARKE